MFKEILFCFFSFVAYVIRNEGDICGSIPDESLDTCKHRKVDFNEPRVGPAGIAAEPPPGVFPPEILTPAALFKWPSIFFLVDKSSTLF